MNTAALLTDLRKAGVQLYREGTRLIVEAPPGMVTPEIRAELSRAKQELLRAVGRQSPEAPGEDPIAAEALREIAALLAAAYRRHRQLQPAATNPPSDHCNEALANSGTRSVHGVGT